MLTYYKFSFLLGTILTLSLGLFVYLKNSRNIVNKTWFLLTFSTAIWSFGLFWMISATSKEESMFWRWFAESGSVFIPAASLHFIYSLLNLDRKKRKELIICYLFSCFLLILNSSGLFEVEMVPKSVFNFYPTAGIGYYLFFFYFVIVVTYSFYWLIKYYRRSDSVMANQIKYILIGLLPGFFGGGMTFLLTLNIPIPPFGIILYSIFFPITISYAILRHQLMDINIVIRKTFIYSILATIITIAYFILIYIMESIFRGFMGYKSIPWTLSVIVIFTLIFQPLKNLIQSFVDKYFFKGSLLQEYEKAQDELKRTERLKAVGTLAAGMAHEIKNPLTGIKTFTEYLGTNYKDPSFIEKFQKIVGSEVTKINDIVQQLLDFSKPKPLKLEKTNIHILIDQVLSFLNNDFLKYNIKLTKNYDTTLPLLNIDPNQIKQVFLNLLLNSIDAMKQAGTLTITTKLIANNTEITIHDTGTGIPKKDLEHIFDPFYSTKETGTGLGMSIVYGIIKEHKGDISVESELGKGTIFKVRLDHQG